MSVHANLESGYAFDVRSVNRVVCILTYPSSASCLLSSLLDDHPNVLATPDTVMSSFHTFWQKHEHLHLDQLLCEFLDSYAMMFDARKHPAGYQGIETGEIHGFTTLGPDRNECLVVDRDVFKRYMKQMIGDMYPVPRKLFFQALHVAYSRALGRDVSDPIIVFGLHTLQAPHRLRALLDDFSDISFLTMVRHPVRSTASRFRRQLRVGVDIVDGFSRYIVAASKTGAPDPSTPATSWRAVRMEDLHYEPEKTVSKVSEWLGLPWRSSLLESTVNGKQWWNNKTSLQVSGFSTAIASQTFDEFLPWFDRFRLNILLSRKCVSWDYAIPQMSNTLIAKLLVLPFLAVPFKMELMAWSSVMAQASKARTPIAKRGMLFFKAVARGYVRGRMGLAYAWFHSVANRDKEIQLI